MGTKGFDDGRAGRTPDEPKKDLIDLIGVGYSDKQIEQNKKDYHEDYKTGTNQRLADVTEEKKKGK